jgi:hypothetical protein
MSRSVFSATALSPQSPDETVKLEIPSFGWSITEVVIESWLKQKGDAVAQDEPVATIESDKITFELPAPSSGVLTKILAEAGDTVSVGDIIGEIEAGRSPKEAEPKEPTTQERAKEKPMAKKESAAKATPEADEALLEDFKALIAEVGARVSKQAIAPTVGAATQELLTQSGRLRADLVRATGQVSSSLDALGRAEVSFRNELIRELRSLLEGASRSLGAAQDRALDASSRQLEAGSAHLEDLRQRVVRLVESTDAVRVAALLKERVDALASLVPRLESQRREAEAWLTKTRELLKENSATAAKKEGLLLEGLSGLRADMDSNMDSLRGELRGVAPPITAVEQRLESLERSSRYVESRSSRVARSLTVLLSIVVIQAALIVWVLLAVLTR